MSHLATLIRSASSRLPRYYPQCKLRRAYARLRGEWLILDARLQYKLVFDVIHSYMYSVARERRIPILAKYKGDQTICEFREPKPL